MWEAQVQPKSPLRKVIVYLKPRKDRLDGTHCAGLSCGSVAGKSFQGQGVHATSQSGQVLSGPCLSTGLTWGLLGWMLALSHKRPDKWP